MPSKRTTTNDNSVTRSRVTRKKASVVKSNLDKLTAWQQQASLTCSKEIEQAVDWARDIGVNAHGRRDYALELGACKAFKSAVELKARATRVVHVLSVAALDSTRRYEK